MKQLYSDQDFKRESGADENSPWRGEFTRDYARVIHSASFRRLQGKTQVFPGHESDFFRNRLTHSLEVSQIAEGIAARLNHECKQLRDADPGQKIDLKLCSVAGLIHDLGHPPFGHNGERALDDAMRKNGGFEGNAQTLRIVARLEKKVRTDEDKPLGLDLTYRTLAAILKYDRKIPRSRRPTAKLVKGYYESEEPLVKKIREAVIGSGAPNIREAKVIECAIMDLADDIAYSTYDLEDSLKAGFLTPADILCSSVTLLQHVADKVGTVLKRHVEMRDVLAVFTNIFSVNDQSDSEFSLDVYRAYKNFAASGYFRTQLSSQLVGEAIDSVEIVYNEDAPCVSRVKLSPSVEFRVEVLKQYMFLATIYSSRVSLPEFRGYEVVSGIFNALAGERGFLLMPEDVRAQYEMAANDHDTQMRVVCDFVAGMTDRYAMEFFGRLHSDTPQSMFKPV
jgi:dGTPase